MFWYWSLDIDVIVLSSAIIINMFVLFATDMSLEIATELIVSNLF